MNRESVKTDSGSPGWGTVAQYIFAYILWIGFCALSFWIIWLVRTNLIEDIFFMHVNPWQLRALDRWSVWVMGAGWIVAIFLAEGYLRTAVEKGRFWISAGKLFAVTLGIIALSYLLHALV